MDVNRASFWVGLVSLAFAVLALPSLVVLLAPASWGVAALVAGLAALLLFVGGFLVWLGRVPPWTVKKAVYTLRIEDTDGKRATLRKAIVLRRNHLQAFDHFTHRSMRADGSLDFKVDPRATVVSSQRWASELVVEVRLPQPVHFLATTETWIEAAVNDSFPREMEAIFIRIEEPTKRVFVQVHLPAIRPPKEVWAKYTGSGQAEALTQPKIADGIITWSCTRGLPIPGLSLRRGRLEVWWRW